MGVDSSWSLKKFREGLSVKVGCLKEDVIEFDAVGIDPSVANALRRIMISEVPTMAIEHVFYVDNTSVIAVRTPFVLPCQKIMLRTFLSDVYGCCSCTTWS